MALEIIHEAPMALAEYAKVCAGFDVNEMFVVRHRRNGLGGLELIRRAVDHPFRKDYDAISENHPLDWAARFDMQRWCVLAALQDGHRVGGAVIAHDAPTTQLLEGRENLAVLWDLRVAPEVRRRGVGAALFEAAARWAAERGARRLEIETQNVNVPACEFYAAQGCVLGAINVSAYPSFPTEVQFLWYKDLTTMGRKS